MHLELKQIIDVAAKHFGQLLPTESNPQLEEIEREGKNWAVTFSVPVKHDNPFYSANGPFGYNRVGKIVVVDGENGEFIALRQRAA